MPFCHGRSVHSLHDNTIVDVAGCLHFLLLFSGRWSVAAHQELAQLRSALLRDAHGSEASAARQGFKDTALAQKELHEAHR